VIYSANIPASLKAHSTLLSASKKRALDFVAQENPSCVPYRNATDEREKVCGSSNSSMVRDFKFKGGRA